MQIWVFPYETGDGEYGTSEQRRLLLGFRYTNEEFIDASWRKALNKYASTLGFDDSGHGVPVTWDDVNEHPGNPELRNRLAQAYSEFGDGRTEIAGWWRLFERHPTQLSFLKLLYRACIREKELEPSFPSILSFARICALLLLSQKAKVHGLGHLDWWPLACEEEFKILQPHLNEKQLINVKLQRIYSDILGDYRY